MIKYLFILTIIFSSINTFSQKTIEITTELVGQNYNENLLYLKASVKNNSSKEKCFWIMKCSWDYNWITNNDSIIVKPKECDSNYPTLITLNPANSIDFYMTLKSLNPLIDNFKKDLKIGFVLIEKTEYKTKDFNINLFDLVKDKVKQDKVYWSDNFSVEFVGEQYILRSNTGPNKM